MTTVMLLTATCALTAGAPDRGLFFDVLPTVSENGSALVQLRPICRWLNANAEVDGRVITITKPPTIRLRLTVGSRNAKIADSDFVLRTAPTLVRGHTMVPLRFVAEGFGAWVDSSGRQIQLSMLQENQVVVIATPPHPQSHLGKMYAVLSRYLGLIPPPKGEEAALYRFNTLSRRYAQALTADGAAPESVEQSLRARKIAGARVERDYYDGKIQGWLDVVLLGAHGKVERRRVTFVKEADGWRVDDVRPR
ncbi:MAG: copper amine oxidase N-terminal domain-containing protein [Armatimonadota bacterium]